MRFFAILRFAIEFDAACCAEARWSKGGYADVSLFFELEVAKRAHSGVRNYGYDCIVRKLLIHFNRTFVFAEVVSCLQFGSTILIFTFGAALFVLAPATWELAAASHLHAYNSDHLQSVSRGIQHLKAHTLYTC